MDRTLTCYAMGHQGKWHAICLDLDLAVDGPSFNEVYDSLNFMIRDYLETVSEMPAEDRGRLLNRRAPWHVRARYKAVFLLHLFLSWVRDNGDDNPSRFPVETGAMRACA